MLFKGPLRAAAVQAQQALAFVARREGQRSMEASRWRHVMSLELGWMSPGQAARYVEAAHHAGLLVADGDALRLSFDPRIDIPRGFRPDPDDLPAPVQPTPAATEADGDESAGFAHWLSKVASARGEDAGATMQAVEQLQQAAGGLLHAEAALLVLAQQAGLDVRGAAQSALKRLRA